MHKRHWIHCYHYRPPLVNGDGFDRVVQQRRVQSPPNRDHKSPERGRNGSPLPMENRRLKSPPPAKKSPRGPHTPVDDPRDDRPPSPLITNNDHGPPRTPPDSHMRQRTPSTERRQQSADRLARAKRRPISPCTKRYPTPEPKQVSENQLHPRDRTPLPDGELYTRNQESTEENGVFIDKVATFY